MNEDFREERKNNRQLNKKQRRIEPDFKQGKIVKDRSKKYLKQVLYDY